MTKETYNKEYYQRYREERGDYLREYSRNYYKENKEYFQDYYKENKQYFKDYYTNNIANKRFVYFMIGKDDKVLYIGSTKGKYRIIHHLQGHSQLELYPRDWEQLGLNKLVYADVTDITRDDAERYFLEKMYIQMYQPLLNSDNEPDPKLELERIESFTDLIYNDYIEFREVDIKKITLSKDKITFGFDNLILQ